jgi:hypothetical protein
MLTNTYSSTNTTTQNLTMLPRHERLPATSRSRLRRSCATT